MNKKRKLLLRSIVILAIFLGVASSVSAKLIGWEKNPGGTTDWADGRCAYRETCSTFYFFGIAVADDCKTETIVCLY